MKSLFKVLLLVWVFATPFAWATSDVTAHEERNYFQFEIPKYETQRQGGQTVTVYVRYAYQKGLPESKYVDYRVMRQDILKFMEPTDEYPANVFWEILATTMGKDLMQHYPLDGVSVQLVVFDNPRPGTYEPGDHGPIYTIGTIEPLAH
ncbi:MAG: hypothetical protein WC627_04430 [Legionella sp.]